MKTKQKQKQKSNNPNKQTTKTKPEVFINTTIRIPDQNKVFLLFTTSFSCLMNKPRDNLKLIQKRVND